MARTRQSVLQLFNKGGGGAGIGGFVGGSSRRIVLYAKAGTLYLIDPGRNIGDPGLDKATARKKEPA